MPKDCYIHCANGNTSLVELCDRDGNVIAEIMPKGTPVHRQIVIDLFRTMVESLEDLSKYEPYEQEHFPTNGTTLP